MTLPESLPPRARPTLLVVFSRTLCAASVVVALWAVSSWFYACDDRLLTACPDGKPSFELVFQAVLAVLASVVALAGWFFAKKGSRAAVIALAALVIILFVGWALFLDAAIHDWDDLKYFSLD